jgi:peptide-methionine (R)-S-oxide reductase
MKDDGMYHCAACGASLFSSDTKFDSGTGWPSFTDPAVADAVELRADDSHGMPARPGELDRSGGHRTEVVCKNCGSHLGHVFEDGPKEKGGKRFCINSCSLDFKGKEA